MSQPCCGDNSACGCGGNARSQDSGPRTDTVPVVTSRLKIPDILGGWKVRWGIGRDRYTVNPGLYAIGAPTEASPVLVTANYKFTFDSLRKELKDLDAWILVLDTKGVNVWCAAGKGTFGTEELIRRVRLSGLETVVSHRKLIVPQLGAPGVSAHAVKTGCGFHVTYGPVLAKDIPLFLRNNCVKTAAMRTVRFPMKDRLAVIPVELVQAFVPILLLFSGSALLAFIQGGDTGKQLPEIFFPYLGAFLAGIILVPAFLPYIPFRAFAAKGFLVGLIWAGIVPLLWKIPILTAVSHFLILPAVSAFYAMNFTGSSTFTSLTGVKKEVKYTLFPAISAVSTGAILRILSVFIAV